MEIVEVSLEYPAAAGSAVRLARRAQVGFSANPEAVANSVNREVSADVVLQRSAALREDAVRAADAGDFTGAGVKLEEARRELADNARITGSREVADAAVKMADESRKMQEVPAAPAQYKRLRKELKGRAYQERNSQSFRQ